MIPFTELHPSASDLLGFLPTFLSERDPRSAKEQFNANYAHGGGWHPLPGFKMLPSGAIKYPGDPPLPAVAKGKLRNETILIYPYAWVAILQQDGSYEVARMD